jgi:hypothetical protein
MVMKKINPDDSDEMGRFFGPGQVDHQIRQAIQMCWMGLPKARRTVEEVETQVRRLVERALRDFREDGREFGVEL